MKKKFLVFFLNLIIPVTFATNGSLYTLNQNWKNQLAKDTTLKSLMGTPSVITMVFTNCPGACPMMVNNMKIFDHELTKKEKDKISYHIFSLDPKRDVPEVLEKFKTKMNLDDRWNLYTSNAENVRELSVALGFSYKMLDTGDFTHSTTLYLISAKGEILAKHEPSDDWSDFLTKFRNELASSEKK